MTYSDKCLGELLAHAEAWDSGVGWCDSCQEAACGVHDRAEMSRASALEVLERSGYVECLESYLRGSRSWGDALWGGDYRFTPRRHGASVVLSVRGLECRDLTPTGVVSAPYEDMAVPELVARFVEAVALELYASSAGLVS